MAWDIPWSDKFISLLATFLELLHTSAITLLERSWVMWPYLTARELEMWSFARNITVQNKLGILLLRKENWCRLYATTFMPKAGRSTASIIMSFLLNFQTSFHGFKQKCCFKDTWAYSPIFPNPIPQTMPESSQFSMFNLCHAFTHSFIQ